MKKKCLKAKVRKKFLDKKKKCILKIDIFTLVLGREGLNLGCPRNTKKY